MKRDSFLSSEFLYGAAVYPEFVPREEWLRLLDDMVASKMNVVRLLESAWGFLEPREGERRHERALTWLDDAKERGLRCILGTGSFLPPQWLFEKFPDALVRTRSGERAHPLARKSACLEHPDYRAAVRAHAEACARALASHPAVLVWQIDNEIDRVNLDWTCHCERCEAAWTGWLRARYGAVHVLNEKLRLDHWGLEIASFEALPLPRVITELGRHPGLAALEARFRRDRVTTFLREQSDALVAGGASQPKGHNFFIAPDFTAEEEGDAPFLDYGAYDLYLDWQAREDASAQLRCVRLMERQRACHDGDFLLMETSMGTVGGVSMVAPAASEALFLRRLLLALASGARGVLFWTGTVWRGGPWIYHGALHDFSGHAVPEMARFARFGSFLRTHGPSLLASPVEKDVAVIGSHAGDALAELFPVIPGSERSGRLFEAACRARGRGVDILPPRLACREGLSRYRTVVLWGEAQALATPRLVAALEEYAKDGGTVVIGPMAGYVSEEGTVAAEGLASTLRPLTGAGIPIFRWFGEGVLQMERETESCEVLNGFIEAASIDAEASVEVVARVRCEDPDWNGRPAILRRTLGKGTVWKYLCTPISFEAERFSPGLPERHPLLGEDASADVLVTPRAGGSLFLVNMANEERVVRLSLGGRDRFEGTLGARCSGSEVRLKSQGSAWVE